VYKDEADKAIRLSKAIGIVLRGCEGLQVEYPYLQTAVSAVVDGLIPTITVKCKKAKKGICRVEASDHCGGLKDAAKVIDEALSALRDEVALEETPDLQEGAEYDI
jgi:hypothetical protein